MSISKTRTNAPTISHDQSTRTIVESILTFIEDMKELGYRSHSEFIIDAIRRRVEDLIRLTNERA